MALLFLLLSHLLALAAPILILRLMGILKSGLHIGILQKMKLVQEKC